MVNANLYVICGNCGCNKEFEWKSSKAEIDEETGEIYAEEDVYIYCNNCSTLHSLNKNAKHRTKKRKVMNDL